MVDRYRIYEVFSKDEHLLSEEEYEQYAQRPAWIVNGQVMVDENQVKQLLAQHEQMKQQHQMQMADQMDQMGLDDDAILPEMEQQLNIQEITYMDLIAQGQIQVVNIQVKRVYMCVIIGDKHLYSRELPIEDYPIIPFMSLHTRTPYPQSDIRMVKGLQEYINKMRSLIVRYLYQKVV